MFRPRVEEENGPFAPGFEALGWVADLVEKHFGPRRIRIEPVRRAPPDHPDRVPVVSALVSHPVEFRDGPVVAEEDRRDIFRIGLGKKTGQDLLCARLVFVDLLMRVSQPPLRTQLDGANTLNLLEKQIN
jgi:hypothetical protein